MPSLSNLKVAEVSFCKKGMNQHARVALFKSADRVETGFALHKATFDEALQANMTAEAVNEAFYQSFSGLWERNDAFRCALTDELSEGGDGTEASAAYVASVKSLVDTAVAAAREAGATAADTAAVEDAVEKAVTEWVAEQELKKEQTTMTITTKAQLLSAVAKFDPAKTTFAEVTEIQKAAETLGETASLPAALAKSAPAPDPVLVRKVAILEMPADVRKHFDGLAAGADQDAFIAKTADERASIVAELNKEDPVLYTTAGGTPIRKSDGPTVLALAKSNDAQAEEIKKLRGENATATLDQRAAAYPNVAKAVAVAMLKTADTQGLDSEDGKATIAALTGMNKAQGGVFKAIGEDTGGDAGEATIAKAKTDFNTEVSKAMDEGKITRDAAMTKVRAERPDLFAAAFPDMVEEAA